MKSNINNFMIMFIFIITMTYTLGLSIFKSIPENIQFNQTDEKVINEMTEKILNDPELLKKFSTQNNTELSNINEQDLLKIKFQNSTSFNTDLTNQNNNEIKTNKENDINKTFKTMNESIISSVPSVSIDQKVLNIPNIQNEASISNSKLLMNKTQENIEDTFNSIISKIENPNYKTNQKLTKYQKKIQKIFDNNIKILSQFNIQEFQLFTLIESVIRNKKLFLRLPVSAQNIISQAYENQKFLKMFESKKNNLKKLNSELVSSTISSVSFIDHNNKLGRKGVMKMINNEGNYQQVWVVSNEATFSVFNDLDHMNLIHSIKSSDLSIIDFVNSSCFQITRKSDEIRNLKLEVREKIKPKNYFNSDKFEKNLSDLIDNKSLDNKINFKGKTISINSLYKISENKLVKEMKNKGVLKDFKNLFCLVNTYEKEIWIKSIKNHSFIE